jgi:ubiquinone/menaquinone biosynthesis C-methylase UbiE
MPWYYAVAERDHDLQNPTSPEKIRHVGELLRLGAHSRVLDVACGMGGPAMLLASTFGCTIVGVERSPDFVTWGRERIESAGLSDRVEIVEGDASAYPLEPAAWDAALCLGATFVFDDLPGTVAALMPTVKPGGYLAVGEPFWKEWPLPRDVDDMGYVPLEETVERFTARGLALTGLVAASVDDWDRYESLHWRALEEYLAENDDAEIGERHERARADYLRYERRLLGWGIFVGRKPD